jgi:hypothetical protein
MLDPLAYYAPEMRVFPELARRFAETGQLTPEELYLILDWKAPRARTKHLKRLAELSDGSFESATRNLADDLRVAAGPKERLQALMTKWGFRLSTASAILSVLYPDTFTIYDVRVCRMLGGFDNLGQMNWSEETWRGYQGFIEAVKAATPPGLSPGLSLRDRDRWLWGKDKQATMLKELSGTR